jgi:alpha-tubulin suppressor-like RCC1 family protein
VTAARTIMCWGNNNHGQLGNGTATTALTPVAVSGITTAKTVATGGSHTCAIVDDGDDVHPIRCWGLNSSGQFGNNGKIDSSVPVAVP